MSYLVIFFTALLSTIFFTPYLIGFLTKERIVDNPDKKRRINLDTVPRMGGIIIYFVVMLLVISFYPELDSLRYFVMASIVIVSLGIVDDIIGVNWDKKFLFQTIASLLLIFFLSPFYNSVKIFGFILPYPFNHFVLFILVLGAINSINLLDGLDGLVSGFSLLVVSVTFLLGYFYNDQLLMILSISLAGALLGFLKFNAYPARIFLGDAGSQSLGFFLISVALLTTLNIHKNLLDLTFTIILLGVPIIDTLKVMILRILGRKNLFMPDQSHTHHLLFGLKIRHKVTVFIIQGFSFLYAAASIYYLRVSETDGIILFVIITIPFLFINKILAYAQRKVHPTFFGRLYSKIPQKLVSFFTKILLPPAILVLVTALVGLIPIKSSVGSNFILLSIAFLILLLIYSLINYQKNKQLSDILVFINFIMIFFYSNYSETVHNFMHLLKIVTPNQLITLIVFPILVFFLFFRDKILGEKKTFLSGIDLIIIVFIVLLTVSSNMLPNAQIGYFNTILFHSFLLYLFYKVIASININFRTPLFFLSFIFPVIVLIVLLFNQ